MRSTFRTSDPHFAFSETPRYVGRAIAALAGDGDVGAKTGLALFADDLADDYGFTDLDGSRPHFWRSVEAWIDEGLAKDGELDPHLRWVAASRYRNLHMTPSRGDQMRRYAARLGFESLGAGLRPIV